MCSTGLAIFVLQSAASVGEESALKAKEDVPHEGVPEHVAALGEGWVEEVPEYVTTASESRVERVLKHVAAVSEDRI